MRPTSRGCPSESEGREAMFKQLDDINDNILALSITSEISEEEHHLLDRLLRHYIQQWKRIRLLVVVHHYPCLSRAEALYEDLRMVKLHAAAIERLAVVGDQDVTATYVGLFSLFAKVEADYFPMDQLDTAQQWLGEGMPVEAGTAPV